MISGHNLTASEKGAGSTITGREAGKKDGVVCYDGYVKVPADGKYTFSLQTPGKAYLRLHEATLIDEDFGYEPNATITQDVYLKAGYHKIMLNYLRKETEQSDIKLEWKSTDGDWKAVGSDLFY